MSDDDRDDRDDHGALTGIDLAAWQPPLPPSNLADAVIARLREPPRVAAVEPQPRAPLSTRRTWIAPVLVAAAAVAAISGLALWGTARAPRNGQGDVVATNAEHLALGATAADLDPGAELRWIRAGHRITAHQRRGAVHWTVAGDDALVLDSGGDSSAVTIEASGASLRVEVSMNLSDSRTLGVTTVAAVVAAVVTVAVYQGHVKATSGGQTIQVEPGASIELRPHSSPQPLRPEPSDHRSDPISVGVGAGPDARALRDQLAAADRRIAELTAQLAAGDTDPAADAVTVTPPVLDEYRLGGDRNIVPDEATRRQIDSSAAVRNDSHLVGSFRLCLDDHGAVSRVQVVKSTRFETYDQTIVEGMRGWTYRPFLFQGRPTPACAVFTFAYSTDEPKPGAPRGAAASCTGTSVEDLVRQATNQYDRGFSAPALRLMRKALACEQNTRLYRLAGLFACAAHDVKAARDLVARIPTASRAPLAQRCAAEGITLEPQRD
jgi:hypothetical protein